MSPARPVEEITDHPDLSPDAPLWSGDQVVRAPLGSAGVHPCRHLLAAAGIGETPKESIANG